LSGRDSERRPAAAAKNDLLHPIDLGHLVQDGEMPFVDEGGAEVVGEDLVDEIDVRPERWAGVARRSDGNRTCL
jgi:hypothetical protein